MAKYWIGQKDFEVSALVPGLYIVSTPIGNLQDVTLRALQTLAGADIVACEDTRVTSKLLRRFGIQATLQSYREHNAEKAGSRLLEAIAQGQSVAVVSDAGTPMISDPGFDLAEKVRESGHAVTVVPGVSAPVAALVASGMPCSQFTFAGFLPPKEQARRNVLARYRDTTETVLFFEAPHRLTACLIDMKATFGPDREVAICREMTKMHEEIRRGSLAQIVETYAQEKVRGEIVMVLGPKSDESEKPDTDALLRELLESMTVSRAAAEAAKLIGMPKRALYQRALELADQAAEKRPRRNR